MAIDYVNYVLGNPDLRENVEALGLTNAEIAEWGDWHWNEHGEDEGRLNTPDAQDFAAGFTQTLGPEHYQERDVRDVLQASVRAGYKGAEPEEIDYSMWEAREGIDPAWNLGQYTAEGWNLAPDAPYRTGILGNTIAVNQDIGQLVPTTAAGNVGDPRFIQDRYVDASLAKDFPVSWVTNNKWTGPENLGGYWEDLTSATRDASGNLVRASDYDPTTAARPSTVVGPRGAPTGGGTVTGGGLLGNMYEAAYEPRGLLDWEKYQTDPDFVLQQNKMNLYQPAALGMGALPVYGAGTGTSIYGNNITSTSPYDPVIDATTTTNASNTVKDASGKSWIMTSDGQWIPTTSDYGSILTSGDPSKYPAGHYDSNGMWVGAEGFGPGNVNPAGLPGWSPTANFGIFGTTGPFGNAGYSPEDNAAAAAAASEIYGSQVGMG